MKKKFAVLVALIGLSGIVHAEDGAWKSVQVTFSHRQLANGATEIDWHTEKTETSAQQAKFIPMRRQYAMNVGKIARYTLHYKESSMLAELQKEIR